MKTNLSVPTPLFPGIGARPTSHSPPRYALRHSRGFWKLTFNGQEAHFKHERGILYVAYLLNNPPSQPIHALDLAARIPALSPRRLGITELVDPATGEPLCLERHARLHEHSLTL